MKIIAGILALIVLVLTVQPAFAYNEREKLGECASDCCSNDFKVPAGDEPSGDPCSDFCNPFLKCGGCAASTIEFFAFSIQSIVDPHTKFVLAKQRVNSQFAPVFWQPPKIG